MGVVQCWKTCHVFYIFQKLKLEQFEPCSGTPITSYLDDSSTTDLSADPLEPPDPSADPLEPPDPLALSWGEDPGCADGQQTDDGKVQGKQTQAHKNKYLVVPQIVCKVSLYKQMPPNFLGFRYVQYTSLIENCQSKS